MKTVDRRNGPRRPLGAILCVLLVLGGNGVLAQEDTQVAPPEIQVELGFGTGIDRQTRSLTGESGVFPVGQERVFCRMHILNAPAPTTVTHAWYWEGKTMAQVELNVGSTNWRTWSSKRLLPTWTGNWEVKVLDQAGKVLATSSFQVQ
jgi:hypothetical protein